MLLLPPLPPLPLPDSISTATTSLIDAFVPVRPTYRHAIHSWCCCSCTVLLPRPVISLTPPFSICSVLLVFWCVLEGDVLCYFVACCRFSHYSSFSCFLLPSPGSTIASPFCIVVSTTTASSNIILLSSCINI